jgi:D-alanyl-lipoteichoic acid acyltransferase DltB (MBOAT superfamily)
MFLLLGYVGVRVLRQYRSAPVFALFTAAVLGAFFSLKRYSFVPADLMPPFVYTTIGLSYVFFRVLHLIIDVRQGVVERPVGPLSYLNYTLHFTALVSGPIQLYQDYRRMEECGRDKAEPCLPLDVFVVGACVERMITGFFKVIVISAALLAWQKARLASLASDESLLLRTADVALIGALYPLFLYANFSGYTDFVIGVARLFRIQLPENFNNPFVSESFISFWGRWHITLSNWLKTYVYTPLLMTLMRRIPYAPAEPLLGVLAYFVTFFLVGAWHGQTSEFLFFGVLQGGGVALNKLYQITMASVLTRKGYRALCARPVYRAAARGLTYTWFAFTLFWFWSNWSQLGRIAQAAGSRAIVLACVWVLMAAAVLLALLVYLQDASRRPQLDGEAFVSHRYVRTVVATALVVITVATIALISGPAPDLVYKNF